MTHPQQSARQNASEFGRLVGAARAKYQRDGLSLLQNCRSTQTIAVLAIVAILLTLARMRDQLPTVTLPDVPALVLAPFVLTFALLALRHLHLQVTLPVLPRLPANELIPRVKLRWFGLVAQAQALADSFGCHKGALAEPTGLLSAYLDTVMLVAFTWRERIKLPRVVEMFVAHLRGYIDMRNIRELVEQIGRWVVLPTPHASTCEFALISLSLVPLRAAANEPRAIALRC